MRRKRCKGVHALACPDSVHEYAHTYAAVSRFQQPVSQEPSGEIVSPDECLHIEAAHRQLRTARADHERFGTIAYEAEGRCSGMKRLAWCDRSIEPCPAAGCQCSLQGLWRAQTEHVSAAASQWQQRGGQQAVGDRAPLRYFVRVN